MHDVAWRCDRNYVRSKDAQKQLAQKQLCSYVRTTEDTVRGFNRRRCSIKNIILLFFCSVRAVYTKVFYKEQRDITNRAFTIFCFILQFVPFSRSYNITPLVLISANHSTKTSGNSEPVHNGISTWIEVSLAQWRSAPCETYVVFCLLISLGQKIHLNSTI